jgi:hypothetical protein
VILTASLASASMLLVAAGAAKVVDPSRTSGALAALGWPSSPLLVRLGASVELVLGVAVLVIGGQALAMLVAASYLGFTVFVMTALRHGAPIGTVLRTAGHVASTATCRGQPRTCLGGCGRGGHRSRCTSVGGVVAGVAARLHRRVVVAGRLCGRSRHVLTLVGYDRPRLRCGIACKTLRRR